MGLKQIFGVWKNVFSSWKYAAILIINAILFYSLNVLIASWQNIKSIYPSFGLFNTLRFFFASWTGFRSTVIFHSFVSLIIISFLFGMLFSLILYKTRLNTQNIQGNKKVGLFGGIGVFFGALAPGCVSCGMGLASILGLGVGALAFLPYEGQELSFLSVGLLGFSILKISNNMYKCDIKGGIK